MTNVSCTQCGTVNLVTDEVCRVCGGELRSVTPPSEEHDPSTLVYTSDIPPFTGATDGIGPAFHLFRKNFWLITKIVFVIVAPLEIFKALSLRQGFTDWQLPFGLFVMQLVCNFLLVPALFYSLLKVVQTGNAPGVNEAYRWSLGKLPKLALAAVISWILTMIGFVLLIIPGIILSIVFALVYPVAVFEKGSAVDALRRSAYLTRGRRLSIFLAYFVITLLVGVISMGVSGVASIFVINGITFWPFEVGIAVISDIFAEGLTVLSLVIYLGILRTLESGQSVIE